MKQITRHMTALAITAAAVITLTGAVCAAKEKTEIYAEIINRQDTEAVSVLDQVTAGIDVALIEAGCDRFGENHWADELGVDLSALTAHNGTFGNTQTLDEASDDESIGRQLAECARELVGLPYVYGGTSTSGFDCSGFVQYVYRQNGYEINRTATAQLRDGYAVKYEDMKPGDILYFGYDEVATHVGIYVGGGEFVHAENSGTGVVVSKLSQPWYAARFLCAHRIAEPSE